MMFRLVTSLGWAVMPFTEIGKVEGRINLKGKTCILLYLC